MHQWLCVMRVTKIPFKVKKRRICKLLVCSHTNENHMRTALSFCRSHWNAPTCNLLTYMFLDKKAITSCLPDKNKWSHPILALKDSVLFSLFTLYFSHNSINCFSFVVFVFLLSLYIHKGTALVAKLSLCFYCLLFIGSRAIAWATTKGNNKRSIVLLFNL